MFQANSSRMTAPVPVSFLKALGRHGRREVLDVLAACPKHGATPLSALPAQAAALGIAGLSVKDEAGRFGLGSFKALGGAYAVIRFVLDEAARQLGRPVSPSELGTPPLLAIARDLTVACATDGNHGRSVAAGARLAGCRAVIFVHAGVSEERASAIGRFGADIVRVAGTYDDSVAEASRQAEVQHWTIISDTSWEGYETIPLRVMQGYTVMAGEAFDALPAPPTHIFLQAGVGGMAAAVAAHALDVYKQTMPRLIVVEPARAACLFASARAGRLVSAPHGEPTVMAMLECYEPSRIAWEILQALADGFVTLEEDEAVEAMRRLANPLGTDPAIVAGESGGAGLAGLVACLADETARTALGLDAASRVLVFNTEGATDPEIYRKLVGRSPWADIRQEFAP